MSKVFLIAREHGAVFLRKDTKRAAWCIECSRYTVKHTAQQSEVDGRYLDAGRGLCGEHSISVAGNYACESFEP